MVYLLLNTLALDPHRWTPEKVGYYRLEALLAPIAEAGFHGVELWQYHLCRESKAEVQQLRTKAEALGVRFPVVGMYPQLHLDGKSRGEAWDEVKKVVDYAALLGAEIVKIFVGSRATDDLTEAEYERSLAFLADLVALAGDPRVASFVGERLADRVIALKPWDEGSDRDFTVAGRRSRRFYRYATRWMINEVAWHKQRRSAKKNFPKMARSFLGAKVGRLGMLMTKNEVER